MINGTIVLRKTKLKNADLTLVTDICTGFFDNLKLEYECEYTFFLIYLLYNV